MDRKKCTAVVPATNKTRRINQWKPFIVISNVIWCYQQYFLTHWAISSGPVLSSFHSAQPEEGCKDPVQPLSVRQSSNSHGRRQDIELCWGHGFFKCQSHVKQLRWIFLKQRTARLVPDKKFTVQLLQLIQVLRYHHHPFVTLSFLSFSKDNP